MSPNASNALNGTDDPTEADPALWYWSIRCMIAVLIVIGNSVIICLIMTRRRLHTTTNWLTLSLALADLLVGIALTPSTVVCHFTSLKCNWSLISVASLLFLYVSVGNLCAVSVDRYVAVVIPFKYVLFKTSRVRTRLILCAWIVPSILSSIPLAWQHSSLEFRDIVDRTYYAIQTIALIFIPCVLMLLAYVHIALVLWRQNRVVRSFANTTTRHRNSRNLIKSKKEAFMSLKVYGLILLLFVACWCLSAYRYMCYSFKLDEVSDNVVYTSRLLMLLNSAINPVIYALMKRDIRAELKTLIGVHVGTTDATKNEGDRSRHTAVQRAIATDAL